ncbi:MAG: PadR family transcriptional regulator [Actinomycetota bacterium]|nr:PadR family transcriptional regulator [Actinomycetota bacterium]
MSPVFAHGQLRLYLLALLDDAPRHGYEVIRALEERFEGMYAPSAGTVYPRLARLEEDGLVVREEQGRKSIYRITDAGRAEVEARRGELETLQQDVTHSVREMADQLRSQVRQSTADLRSELADAVRAARSSATPAGGHPERDGGEVDRLMEQLRRQVRTAVRRHRVDEAQLAEIRAALTDAWARIATALEPR